MKTGSRAMLVAFASSVATIGTRVSPRPWSHDESAYVPKASGAPRTRTEK